MARRRLSPDDIAALTTAQEAARRVPARLRVCYVEDWVQDGEPVSLHGRQHSPDRETEARMLLARRRFREARAKWLRDLERRGIEPPKLPTAGRPLLRHPRDARAKGVPRG